MAASKETPALTNRSPVALSSGREVVGGRAVLDEGDQAGAGLLDLVGEEPLDDRAEEAAAVVEVHPQGDVGAAVAVDLGAEDPGGVVPAVVLAAGELHPVGRVVHHPHHAEALGAGLQSLEIVGHGKVLAQQAGPGSSGRVTAQIEIAPSHGMWIAARCRGTSEGQIAHTTPVYVTVGGDGFHNPETVRANAQLSEQWLQELEQDIANPPPNRDAQASFHKAELARQIAEARSRLASLPAK